jgi:hypothetical protein
MGSPESSINAGMVLGLLYFVRYEMFPMVL